MKQIILFLFIASATLACKKDDPDTQLSKVEGTWQLVARKELVDGKYIWKDVPKASHNILIIRSDGLVTDVNGFPPCCGPSSLSIDGNLVKIISEEVANGRCQSVKCGLCETWGIETNGNQITVSACGSSPNRYVRGN